MSSNRTFDSEFSRSAETDVLMSPGDALGTKHGFKQDIKNEIEKIKTFFWNPRKQKFMKRDDISWSRLLLFYFTFFCVIAAYAAMAFALYLEVYIDKNHPRTQGQSTLLLGWPSLGMRPMPYYRTTFIRFEQGKAASYKPFSDHIQAFLWQYENLNQESEALIDCTNLPEADRPKNRACRFQIDTLGAECVWQQDYGYDAGQPCILLKLTKIFGWVPDLYDSTDFPKELGNRTSDKHIGVTCEGENPIDHENIGPLIYWPPQGFPSHFYPYYNQEGYRAPLVMVKFAKLTNGVVINVWCKAWARNIKHHRYDDMGGIHFELLVD